MGKINSLSLTGLGMFNILQRCIPRLPSQLFNQNLCLVKLYFQGLPCDSFFSYSGGDQGLSFNRYHSISGKVSWHPSSLQMVDNTPPDIINRNLVIHLQKFFFKFPLSLKQSCLKLKRILLAPGNIEMGERRR